MLRTRQFSCQTINLCIQFLNFLLAIAEVVGFRIYLSNSFPEDQFCNRQLQQLSINASKAGRNKLGRNHKRLPSRATSSFASSTSHCKDFPLHCSGQDDGVSRSIEEIRAFDTTRVANMAGIRMNDVAMATHSVQTNCEVSMLDHSSKILCRKVKTFLIFI